MYFQPPNELETITTFEQELIQLDGEIKRYDREIATGTKVTSELEDYKNEIKTFSSYFKSSNEAQNIEKIISDEARATGISFTTLTKKNEVETYQNPIPTEGVEVKIDVSDYISRLLIHSDFKGSFKELMTFLSYLTRTEKIISLKNIAVTSSDSSTILNYAADFETYSLIKDVNEEDLIPDTVAAPAPEGAP